MEKLTETEIQAKLADLKDWGLRGGKLCWEHVFEDFNQCFSFMTLVALMAEKMNHHPDWTNVYNRLEIQLHTHDVGGISLLDFDLASRISGLVKQI